MATKAINVNEENGRVSVGQFERYYKSVRQDPFALQFGEGDNAFKVIVKPHLSFSEAMDFVDSVINLTFDEEGNYYSVFADFALRRYTILYYTNMTLPDDMSKQYELLYGAHVYDVIAENINNEQRYHILDAVNRQMRFEEQKILSSARAEVNNAVEQISKLADRYEAFMETAQKLAGPDLFDLAKRLQNSASNVIDATTEFQRKDGVAREEADGDGKEGSQGSGGSGKDDSSVPGGDTKERHRS